jgi:histidinol-phosphate/aromatic aminotransferase/cobyric acid decarboxylase-like protein
LIKRYARNAPNRGPSDNSGLSVLDLAATTELRLLDFVQGLAERYHSTYGTPPINLSHWDTSPTFRRMLGSHVSAVFDRDVIDYVYPSRVGSLPEVLKKLGIADGHDGLIVPSGSAAIVCAANWLRSRRVTHTTVIGPTYWTTTYALNILGIDTTIVPAHRCQTGFRLPDIEDRGTDQALWITQPYYSTGVYLDRHDRERLERALARGAHLVVDECLALPGREMLRQLSPRENLLAIYEPHKAISINGLKFGVLIMHPSQRQLLRHWGTVLFGSVGVGALAAISHFLSLAFDRSVIAFETAVTSAFESIRTAVRYTDACFDDTASGNYVTMYLSGFDSSLESDADFTWELVRRSGAVFIPNSRNHLDPNAGFSFRLNLAAYDPQFHAATVRVAKAARELTASGCAVARPF